MRRKRYGLTEPKEVVISDPVRAKERTMNRAVRLLAAKPRSAAQLRERLLEKNWTNREIVEEVVKKLEEYKYLDDEQYARDLALAKIRQKPQGKRLLKMTLVQKKLDKEVVGEALENAYKKFPEAELITEAIEKRLRIKGHPKTREEQKKFCNHLLRRGFSYELIRDNMKTFAKVLMINTLLLF